MKEALFDTWTKQYDQWFETPAGRCVKRYEQELLLHLLKPEPGELILDAGCGTGVFTSDVVEAGANVVGMDLSYPMVAQGIKKIGNGFCGICADLCQLPFADNSFDRVFSMTAIEFIADAGLAITELDRVTKKGGCVVVTTLNSLSPWAVKRKQKGENGHALFKEIIFRSPDDLRALIPTESVIKTAIHFAKDAPVEDIPVIEKEGNMAGSEKGAFLAAQWVKA